MFKLKIKTLNEEPLIFEFKTLQEVTKCIMKFCDAENLKEVMRFKKEYNVRFYLKYKKGEN